MVKAQINKIKTKETQISKYKYKNKSTRHRSSPKANNKKTSNGEMKVIAFQPYHLLSHISTLHLSLKPNSISYISSPTFIYFSQNQNNLSKEAEKKERKKNLKTKSHLPLSFFSFFFFPSFGFTVPVSNGSISFQ